MKFIALTTDTGRIGYLNSSIRINADLIQTMEDSRSDYDGNKTKITLTTGASHRVRQSQHEIIEIIKKADA